MNKLNEIADKLEEAKAFMKAKGKEALEEAFTEFFAKHPEATAVVWTQYAHYFNDGDPCEFSVNEAELKVDPSQMEPDVQSLLGVNDEENEEDYEDTDYQFGQGCVAAILNSLGDVDSTCTWDICAREGAKRRKLNATEKSLVDDFGQLSSALQSVEELLETVIGSDCLVRVTRDGIETEEYSHE
jgi:hypothetical protein